MARERVFFRCPFCGSLRRQKEKEEVNDEASDDGFGGITVSRPLQISIQTITSEGRGRIQNHWEHLDVDDWLRRDELEDFLSELIQNAEDVVRKLKAEWHRCTDTEWPEDGEQEQGEENGDEYYGEDESGEAEEEEMEDTPLMQFLRRSNLRRR
jgi:hypothetical protein